MAVTFPIYIKASILALMGIKGSFIITPKTGSAALPIKDLWAQLCLLTVTFAAIIWGLNRLYYERYPLGALIVNMLWCLYHLLFLSSVLYFNVPYKSEDQ